MDWQADIDPTWLEAIETRKNAAACLGKGFESGLVIVILNARGTEAWVKAKSERRAAGTVPSKP
jgi:hypothetical protein